MHGVAFVACREGVVAVRACVEDMKLKLDESTSRMVSLRVWIGWCESPVVTSIVVTRAVSHQLDRVV